MSGATGQRTVHVTARDLYNHYFESEKELGSGELKLKSFARNLLQETYPELDEAEIEKKEKRLLCHALHEVLCTGEIQFPVSKFENEGIAGPSCVAKRTPRRLSNGQPLYMADTISSLKKKNSPRIPLYTYKKKSSKCTKSPSEDYHELFREADELEDTVIIDDDQRSKIRSMYESCSKRKLSSRMKHSAKDAGNGSNICVAITKDTFETEKRIWNVVLKSLPMPEGNIIELQCQNGIKKNSAIRLYFHSR